jgi:hypothetical protein
VLDPTVVEHARHDDGAGACEFGARSPAICTDLDRISEVSAVAHNECSRAWAPQPSGRADVPLPSDVVINRDQYVVIHRGDGFTDRCHT